MSDDRFLPPESVGERIDRAVRELIGPGRVSLKEVRVALREGRIRVDGRVVAPGGRVRGGEAIDLAGFVPRREARVYPETALAQSLLVLWEDDDHLVLSKPSGVPTLPLQADERGSLLGAAIAIAPEIEAAGPPLEGGCCHRLDTPTSGAVLFAKSAEERTRILAAFKSGRVDKRYLALVSEADTRLPDHVECTLALRVSAPKVRVAKLGETGVEARTSVTVIHRVGAVAWVLCEPETGRRHQLRVHLAALGTPILGDSSYGGPEQELRLCLHAYSLALEGLDPVTAPIPDDLAALLDRFGVPSDSRLPSG